MPILSVENVSKTYNSAGGAIHALKNVSFSLEKGELVAVMGTSGSGKSTLLSVLGALDEPSSGKVIVNGQSSEKMFKEPFSTLVYLYHCHHSACPICNGGCFQYTCE